MKKLLSILTISAIFLVFALQTVSAYHNGYAHVPQGRRYVFGFDGDAFYEDYRYVDYYGRPLFRVYRSRHDDDEISKREAIRFLRKSYEKRYDVTAGKTSNEAFCQTCKPSSNPTNWGNKKAYDWKVENTGDDVNYYYQPRFDPQTKTYNWRF